MAKGSENISSPTPNAALSISKLIVYIAYFVVVIIELILLARIVLLLFSANPSTPFVQFIYQNSDNLMLPFNGIFPSQNVARLGYFDYSAIFAAVVYLVVLVLIQSVMNYLGNRKNNS